MDKVLSQPDSQAPKNFASLATAAIYAFFFLDGFLFISWFTVLPEFRDTIGLTDAQLGMVLLGFPIGSLIGMPITGWLSTFRPIRGLCMLSLFFVCLSQAMATQAHSLHLLSMLFVHGNWWRVNRRRHECGCLPN